MMLFAIMIFVKNGTVRNVLKGEYEILYQFSTFLLIKPSS
jgi:hypothetical protein